MLRPFFPFLLLSCLSLSTMAACPPTNVDLAQLNNLKQNDWKITDPQLRHKSALALLDCLADPDPILRDEIAFEALSHWMRADQLDTATTQAIFKTLLPELLAAPARSSARATRVSTGAGIAFQISRNALLNPSSSNSAPCRRATSFSPMASSAST